MIHFKDRIFLMGGLCTNSTTQKSQLANDIWSTQTLYDGISMWSASSPPRATWSPRQGHQGVTHTVDGTDYMYIAGGQGVGKTFLNDVWRWSGEGVTGSWHEMTTSASWPARWAFGYAVVLSRNRLR